jgi:hypothetical protein
MTAPRASRSAGCGGALAPARSPGVTIAVEELVRQDIRDDISMIVGAIRWRLTRGCHRATGRMIAGRGS